MGYTDLNKDLNARSDIGEALNEIFNVLNDNYGLYSIIDACSFTHGGYESWDEAVFKLREKKSNQATSESTSDKNNNG